MQPAAKAPVLNDEIKPDKPAQSLSQLVYYYMWIY